MTSVMAVGELLLELGAVTDAQLAGSVDADLERFLSRIAALRAHWNADYPALSDYQLAIIRKLGPDRPEKLRGVLALNDYLILRKLGRGGIGVVHQAVIPGTGELFALKKIHTDSATARRDLRREFEAMRRLADNPAVVRVIDLISTGKNDVLVMEYQNQGDLADYAKRTPLRWREVARWAATLLEGLAAAHRLGLIHRDIKPQNVMVHRVAGRETVRLSDWGLVKTSMAVESIATAAGVIRGSYDYMPPEQWRGAEHVVPASDVYALGGTLFYALTQGPPFPVEVAGDMLSLCMAHTQRERPSAQAARPDIPAEFATLIQRMMHKDAEQRGTPGELRQQVLALFQAEASTPVVPEAYHRLTVGVTQETVPLLLAPRRPPLRIAPKQASRPTRGRIRQWINPEVSLWRFTLMLAIVTGVIIGALRLLR